MKQRRRILVLLSLLLLMLLSAGYFLLTAYYSNGFCLNTWINGVYCTGKSVEEVNRELVTSMKVPVITVTDLEGREYQIPLDKAGYRGDFEEPLEAFQEQQNPYLWIRNLSSRGKHTISPAVGYDKDLLWALWTKLPFVREARQRLAEMETGLSGEKGASREGGLPAGERDTLEIILTDQGYRLYNGLEDRMQVEEGFRLLQEAVESAQTQVDLRKRQAFSEIALDAAQRRKLALWEKVAAFQDCGIVYDMGDALVPVDEGIACRFILLHPDGSFALDEQGNLQLDQEGIDSFIYLLAEEYNTYGKERTFLSARGDSITIKGGTYGTELDIEAEQAYLKQAFLEKREETHIPAYRREGAVRGKDDIGGTYIEIDMTQQKMYYYQDGECLVETDVVTGDTGRRMGTPEGINYVYNKQKNRVLRGPGYASPVKFWMPVKGNIGIHDASWRSSFGGEIYKKSGSHGCINTPYEEMARLYDLVEIGTPVIMFY